jgi:ATP-binding cassette subfamily B protein
MARPLSLRASLPGLGRLARRFWPYLKPERSLVAVSLLALYADVALRLLEPWPLKVVLDRIIAVMRGGGGATHTGSRRSTPSIRRRCSPSRPWR